MRAGPPNVVPSRGRHSYLGMLSFIASETNTATGSTQRLSGRTGEAHVAKRGLCGDADLLVMTVCSRSTVSPRFSALSLNVNGASKRDVQRSSMPI
jgi:hypothetical protein